MIGTMIRPFTLVFFFISLVLPSARAADTHAVASPDASLEVTITVGESLVLGAHHEGRPVLTGGAIGLSLSDGEVIGRRDTPWQPQYSSVERIIRPVVRQKSAEITEHYRQLTLTSGNTDLEVRVFNDGFGYRWVSRRDGMIEVADESLPLRFPAGTRVLFPEEESLMSHNERHYLDLPLAEISDERFGSTPVLFTTPAGVRVVFSDADLYDYPGMFVRGTGANGMVALLPPVPLVIEPDTDRSPDRDVRFPELADYVARTTGQRSFPWRAFVITPDDRQLMASQLIYLLSREGSLADSSWVKPGRVAWDWYNANLLTGVDFPSGIDNRTYQYYIDFAAAHGIEYVILDEGWSASTTNLFEPNPHIDVPELVAYGEARHVDIILWSLNEPLAKDLEPLLDLYASWGVKGIKVDFMQRNDQPMVNFYEEVARETAARKMLVDFHGAFKPSGLRRAYPNVISYEGVKGAENNKWSDEITPRHNVTLPFIRMVAGPMDYTPGAMSNAHPINHMVSFERPMSIGTRCHEIAKYIVFESPLQMLCDSPTSYEADPTATAFITAIPSVWDETRVLSGRVGEHVLIARRHGDTWYVGAMTNETARTLEVDLRFLPEGEFDATLMVDGPNAHRHAEDYAQDHTRVTADEKLSISLVANGGWAAILRPRL